VIVHSRFFGRTKPNSLIKSTISLITSLSATAKRGKRDVCLLAAVSRKSRVFTRGIRGDHLTRPEATGVPARSEPTAAVIGVLVNPNRPGLDSQSRELQALGSADRSHRDHFDIGDKAIECLGALVRPSSSRHVSSCGWVACEHVARPQAARRPPGSARVSRHSGGGNRDARHMDAVRIACTKPLLLREAVKEAVASGRVEKLQPKEPQTWKTTRRVGKSFANGWRFRRTSDRRQIRPRPSPKGPSSRTSFSAAAASRTTESWDGCYRASAGRDRSSRPTGPPGRSNLSDLVPWHGALIATQDAPTIIAFLDE
jgi:hypothetical protein